MNIYDIENTWGLPRPQVTDMDIFLEYVKYKNDFYKEKMLPVVSFEQYRNWCKGRSVLGWHSW